MNLPVIRKAAVIGAGSMGAQIAAHLANVGISVLLLDVVPTELTTEEQRDGLTLQSPAVRNRVTRSLFDRMRKLSPPPFFQPENSRLITLGNVEDNLGDIREADWIIEAVLEQLELKQGLHRKIAALARPDALITTNTSGLPVDLITHGLPTDYRRRFFAAHFFNPPRYMRLLELVSNPDTDPALLRAFGQFAEEILGKGIVIAKDTPGFIANRIGCYDILTALWLMLDEGMAIDQVDAITGPIIGRPKSAMLRLCDLIGLDLLAQLVRNQHAMLREDDEKKVLRQPPFLEEMIARGWWGEKKGQGFYRRVKTEKGSEILALDYRTFEYRPVQKPSFASLDNAKKISDLGSRVKFLALANDPAGRFAWKHLSATICYAARLVPEAANDLVSVDHAMKWGFNWELGPFELWDALGVAETAQRLEKEGRPVPVLVHDLLKSGRKNFHERRGTKVFQFISATDDYREITESPKAIRLPRLHATGAVIRENGGASLVDLGDGVACFEFRSKMNVIGEEQLALLQESLAEVRKNFKALVIGNQGPHFSAGANLSEFAAFIETGAWKQLADMLECFQKAASTLRAFDRPVVAACHGYTLGGGCEFVMGCHHVVIAAETALGLVETKVGLIPAGHGVKEMLIRCTENIPKGPDADYLSGVRAAWETIWGEKVSSSAAEALQLRYLRPAETTVVLNQAWLIGEAKTKALRLAEDYHPQPPRDDLPAIGQAGITAFRSILEVQRTDGKITEHDAKIGAKLAHVLCGGDLTGLKYVPESHILGLEREAFLSLCGEARTLERIRYTLKTGKPLRN